MKCKTDHCLTIFLFTVAMGIVSRAYRVWLVAVVLSVLTGGLNAATIVATDADGLSLTGTTATYNGTDFSFPDQTSDKYSSVTDSGTDRTATIANPQVNADVYLVNLSLSLDTTTYRYAQVFYSLSSDLSGSTHALRLDTSAQNADWATFDNSVSIPTSAGDHSFIIDLNDGTTDLGGGGYSGNLNQFRWDWWNNTGNDGKAFTLQGITFGSELQLPTGTIFEDPYGIVVGQDINAGLDTRTSGEITVTSYNVVGAGWQSQIWSTGSLLLGPNTGPGGSPVWAGPDYDFSQVPGSRYQISFDVDPNNYSGAWAGFTFGVDAANQGADITNNHGGLSFRFTETGTWEIFDGTDSSTAAVASGSHAAIDFRSVLLDLTDRGSYVTVSLWIDNVFQANYTYSGSFAGNYMALVASTDRENTDSSHFDNFKVYVPVPVTYGDWLTHRYTFYGNAHDAVGTDDGTATTAGTNLEAPNYVADTPSGAVAGAPSTSMEVGMTYGTKKSGFVLDPSVISASSGSVSFWLKANTMSFGNYIFSALPTADGVYVFGSGIATLRSIAVSDGSNMAIVDTPFSTAVWNHVAVSWNDASGSMSLYFNGSEVTGGDNAFTPNSIEPTTVRVGGFSLDDNGNNFANQYDGLMYDLQLYDAPLAAADVEFLYDYPGAVLPNAPGAVSATTVYWDGTPTAIDGASDGGDGNWSTSAANWDNGTTRVAWNNSYGLDTAVLGATAGTVTLGETINLQNLTVNSAYTITGGALNFSAGGSITSTVKDVTFASAISGAPDLDLDLGSAGNDIYFTPTSGSVILGDVTGTEHELRLGGSTSGNTLSNSNSRVYVESGEWTLTGLASGYQHGINGGDLIISSGTLKNVSRSVALNSGATLHYNNPGAVWDSRNDTGDNQDFDFNGGSLDNSSGAPITTSTYNPNMYWEADWTFIGSNGSDSDLYLGNGDVRLNGDRQVTVQNAAATLTIGGVVMDYNSAGSLTKAGPGTLKLTGNNTYTGDTIINAGTQTITQAYLSDIAAVRITDGGVLNLGFNGSDEVAAVYTNGVEGPKGTWGAPGSGADNETDLIAGTGLLSVPNPTALEGIRYWDGGTTNIPGAGDQLSGGGDGTWNGSTNNWDAGVGVAHTNWNNATNDVAVFAGSAGTVDLQSDITVGGLLFELVDGYIIGSNPETQSLQFSGGSTITVDSVTATIHAGITGSPVVQAPGGYRNDLVLEPYSATMTLGDVYVGQDASANNPEVILRGSTAGNSAVRIQGQNDYARMTKDGTGTWTVGDVDLRFIQLDAGTLILNGTCSMVDAMTFNGGTLGGTGSFDKAIAVPAVGTFAPGDPMGTFTVTNAGCAIAGTLAITVEGPACSTLAVDGALDISGATLDVTVNRMPGTPVQIATYTTLNGAFAVTNGIADFVGIDYNYEEKNVIALIPPPQGSVFRFR